jgi:hypothetical protein
VRKILIFLLVVLVVLLALAAVGMVAAMEPCPQCDLVSQAGGCVTCLAVLLWALAGPLATTWLNRRSAHLRPRLVAVFVERPPRST